jgi:dTDP-4-amino-4,6-dideoxygalactose transaminase
MRIVQAPRASAILYHVLISQKEKVPWLLPANICPIVPITFLKAQIPFEFVDISAETLHMDLQQAEDRINQQKFDGLLYSHTYGEPSTPTDFFDRIKSLHPGLLILDDRCLCIPEFEAQSSADVILYSTGYAKIVDLGFGGYAFLKNNVTYQPTTLSFNKDDHDEIERLHKWAVQQRVRFVYQDTDWLETDASMPGWLDYRGQIENCVKLSLNQRARLNEIYSSHLPPELQLQQEYQVWRFNIRVNNRFKVIKAIFEAGLFASSHYASLTGIMAEGQAPHAEALANEVINLFNDHHFDADKAMQICDLILEKYEG